MLTWAKGITCCEAVQLLQTHQTLNGETESIIRNKLFCFEKHLYSKILGNPFKKGRKLICDQVSSKLGLLEPKIMGWKLSRSSWIFNKVKKWFLNFHESTNVSRISYPKCDSTAEKNLLFFKLRREDVIQLNTIRSQIIKQTWWTIVPFTFREVRLTI